MPDALEYLERKFDDAYIHAWQHIA